MSVTVFGPTLLRTTEGSASLSSLVDTVHQTRVVELLTRHTDNIFGHVDTIAGSDRVRDPGRQRRLKQQHKLTHSESEKQPQEVRKGKILNRYLSTIICLFRLLNHLNFRRNFNWKVREIVSVKALIYWTCPFDAYIELSARFIEDVG